MTCQVSSTTMTMRTIGLMKTALTAPTQETATQPTTTTIKTAIPLPVMPVTTTVTPTVPPTVPTTTTPLYLSQPNAALLTSGTLSTLHTSHKLQPTVPNLLQVRMSNEPALDARPFNEAIRIHLPPPQHAQLALYAERCRGYVSMVPSTGTSAAQVRASQVLTCATRHSPQRILRHLRRHLHAVLVDLPSPKSLTSCLMTLSHSLYYHLLPAEHRPPVELHLLAGSSSISTLFN